MLVRKCFFHTKLAIYSLQLLHPLIEHFLNLLDFFFWHSSDPVNTTLLAGLLFHNSALRRSAIHCCIVLKFQLFASLFLFMFCFYRSFLLSKTSYVLFQPTLLAKHRQIRQDQFFAKRGSQTLGIFCWFHRTTRHSCNFDHQSKQHIGWCDRL